MPTTNTTLTLAAAFAMVAAACGSVEGNDTVGPEGATLSSADGYFTVVIPPGALDEEVRITIEPTDECMQLAVACYAVEPYGLIPAVPVDMSYEFSDTEMGNVNPQDLAMFFEMGGVWNVTADREVDMELQTVYGSMIYFSDVTIAPVK